MKKISRAILRGVYLDINWQSKLGSTVLKLFFYKTLGRNVVFGLSDTSVSSLLVM